MYNDRLWHGEDESDSVTLEVRDWHPGAVVAIWAGGELDPAYLTPAAARKAADEWPDILRRLADEAEARAVTVAAEREDKAAARAAEAYLDEHREWIVQTLAEGRREQLGDPTIVIPAEFTAAQGGLFFGHPIELGDVESPVVRFG